MEINNKMTVEQWLDHWFNTYAKRNIKQSTAISYRGYITNHINPLLGYLKLFELNASNIQEYFNNEMDCGNKKTGQPLSSKTLHNIKLMLHKSMKKAYELELIRQNYVEFVELPKIKSPKIHYLSKSEQETLLDELHRSDEKLYFGVYLSAVTGMRLGEVLGLRWGDVDLVNNVLRIERTVNRLSKINYLEEVNFSLNKTEIVVGTPKSDNSIRDIPFNDMVRNEFLIYKNKVKERLEISKIKNEDYVLMLRQGHPVEPKTMQCVFKRIKRAAGIEGVNFHALRHTFATRAIEKGVDVKTLSILLGHSDVAITLNRYAHISDEQKRNVMNILLDT